MRQRLVLACLFMFLIGCHGPLDDASMSEIRSRDSYIDLLKNFLTHDEIFYFNERSESLRLDALNITSEVITAAKVRWVTDKEFMEVFDKWLPQGEGRVVLLGIYNKSFKKDDVLKNGSYRAKLQINGVTYEPLDVKEVKQAFLNRYFPVFNHWAKVFAFHFPVPMSQEPGILVVNWPSGVRTLELKP